MDTESLVQPGRQLESFKKFELAGTLEIPERPLMTAGYADIYCGLWITPQGERVQVAVKELRTLIPKDRRTEEEALKTKVDTRLQREIFIWSQAKHPNLHALLGYCSKPKPRLISAWCRHGNMTDYLQANPDLTRYDKLRLIYQAACGLEHLHSRVPPICHADIKPENVLINDYKEAALSDFGLSRVVQDLEAQSGFTTSETIKGTVRYMAGELFAGQKPNLASDVYAFGGFILTVMSGKSPFDGLLPPVILYRVMGDQPPIPNDHPSLPAYDYVWKLMRRCWARDPTARPTIRKVMELLEQIIHEEYNPQSKPDPPSERSQPTPQSSFDQFINVNATTSSLGGAVGSGLYDGDLARAMSGLNVGTHQDLTSPQLPLPGSCRANATDQNPPINTLHVGNLPSNNQAHPTTLEDALRVLFSRCTGYRKLCFRQKNNGPMCFVEFDDVRCATKALNDLYGHTLNGLVKGGIRLSFSKNPMRVRRPSVSTAPTTLGGGANLFTVALVGIGEGLFPLNRMLPTHHASLSVQSFGAEVSVTRPTRQESVDGLSGSAFGPFGFGQRAFSPPSGSFGAPGQPTRTISQQLQPQPLSSHTHQPLIDGLNHLNSFSDPREHGSLANPAHNNPTVISSSPQPGVEA